MPSRLALRCSCGCEFSVPAGVPVGSLVPCPRCTQTLKIASVPVAPARPVAVATAPRPAPHFGPRKRLGAPSAAPGYVPLRRNDSELLVNYGLFTLLVGVLSTLTPLVPFDSAAWDLFIGYQPWAGIVIAASGVLMMIVYQIGPDFARGPGAPLLVAAFWMVGMTLGVFAGWTAEHVRKREVAADYAAATAPVLQQQAAPLPQFNQPPVQPSVNPPPANPPPDPAAPPADQAAARKELPTSDAGESRPKPSPPEPGRDPFGIPKEDQEKKDEKERRTRLADANRGLREIKKDLRSDDKRVLLQGLEEVQWYFQRAAREEIAEQLTGLLSHPDEEVLLATLKAMKVWADDDQAAAMIPFASHDSAAIRAEAIGLLGKFRNPLGLVALVERLEDDTEIAKAALLRAGKACEAAVRKGLKSKSKTTRLECVKIIGELGIRQALRDVRNLAEFDKDDGIKGEARRVADDLAKKQAEEKNKG